MDDLQQLRGPVTVGVGQWQVKTATDMPPAMYPHYASHAELVDEIALNHEGRYFLAAVSAAPRDWPELLVALRYQPDVGGFDPGVAIAGPCVFIGAGKTVLCYRKDQSWARLWIDQLDIGFWGWRIYSDVVVLQGELTLAAWDSDGHKLWSTFVEPPWTYEVDGNEQITLDVMGSISSFGLRAGPR